MLFSSVAPDNFAVFDRAFLTLFYVTGGDPWPDALPKFNEDGSANWIVAAYIMAYTMIEIWVILQARGAYNLSYIYICIYIHTYKHMHTHTQYHPPGDPGEVSTRCRRRRRRRHALCRLFQRERARASHDQHRVIGRSLHPPGTSSAGGRRPPPRTGGAVDFARGGGRPSRSCGEEISAADSMGAGRQGRTRQRLRP